MPSEEVGTVDSSHCMPAIATLDLCRRDRLMQWTDESEDMVPSEDGAQLRKEAVAWVIRLHGGGISPETGGHLMRGTRRYAHAHMFRTVFTVWDSAELRAAAAAAKPGSSSFNVKTAMRY